MTEQKKNEVENGVGVKNRKLINKAYVTPKRFAECIDSIFSNNIDKVARYFGIKADRDNISVDMLMEWLVENGHNYAEYIGFYDTYYHMPDEGKNNDTDKRVLLKSFLNSIGKNALVDVIYHDISIGAFTADEILKKRPELAETYIVQNGIEVYADELDAILADNSDFRKHPDYHNKKHAGDTYYQIAVED